MQQQFPNALFFDMLDYLVYTELLAAPHRLGERIPQGYEDSVVVDEVQRVPELLNEVHRLIESRRLRFVLTSSSARLYYWRTATRGEVDFILYGERGLHAFEVKMAHKSAPMI